MYLSDGENDAPPPLPDPSGGSMRTSSRVGGGKSPLLLKLKKGAIGNSSASSSNSRGRSVMKQSSPGSTSTPTSATQRAAARKASGTRRRSSSRTRSASVDPSGRVATASYVRQSATAAAAASASSTTNASSATKNKSSRRTSLSSAGIQASSSRSIGSNGSGSTSSVRSRSSSRSKARSSSSASSRNSDPTNDATAAANPVARGSDPPGPMAAVTRRPGGGRRGPSASASPGKERIKKRAERERQRQQQRHLSNEERQIVEAVQQQRVVAAVAASLLGTPPRAATTSAKANTGNASATTGSASSAPKYVNQSPELARKPPATEGSSPVVNDKKTPSPLPGYGNQSPEVARREESPSPVTSTGERKPIDIDAVGNSPSRPLTIGGDDVEAEAEACATSTTTNDTIGAPKKDDDNNIEATDTGRDDDRIARSIEANVAEEPNDATPPTSSNMAKEETTEEAEEEEEEEKHETIEADNGADVGEIIEEIPIEANKDGGDDIMNGVPIQVIDNDVKEKDDTPTDDNIGNSVDDDNDDDQDDESAAGMKDSIQTVKSEDVDPKEAITAALSLLNAPASIGSDVVKSRSFDDADEDTTEEVVAAVNNGAAPVELENGWSGTVTLQASPTPDNENKDTTLPSAVVESEIEEKEIKGKDADEATGTNTEDIEGTITMPTKTFDDDIKITTIEGAVDRNQEKVESNDDNNEGENQSGSTENTSFDFPSDSVDESVPEPASIAGMKRKDGALEDGDIIATPRRKKMSGLRIEVSDSANDGMAQIPNSNVSALASPSASELIEHFEAKSPKAGCHGFVPPSPRSAANKGVQGALSPSREPFRFGAPPAKPVPANQLVVKTPPRHPPSRGGNPGSHATYDYPQRVQSPKWANSLSQSIAKGVCETQQSPRSNNESSGDTERILLEMKKMELRIEARMLHMEQHLEKQMRSKFKYLEARMDERMDEIQASLQVLLARDITEI